MLLTHCMISNAGNSSGPSEDFCEIKFDCIYDVFNVILVSENVFACGRPKKSFGYLTALVGSGWLNY